jgi:hypothetical protein
MGLDEVHCLGDRLEAGVVLACPQAYLSEQAEIV